MEHEKNVLIGSDHNLDLIQANRHSQTNQFIESLALKGYVSSILKPTRVTHQSSTLIKNIFIKGSAIFGYNSYVLVENISDHYPCLLHF